MAETSLFWTDATGDGGPYTQAQLALWLETLLTPGSDDSEGVVEGATNELAVSGVSSPVSVATGTAIVKGRWYRNSAAVDVAVASPAVSTRIDRVVLQADWTAQTVRITLIAGVEGGAAPALTQVSGTTWEISLAQVSITTGGVITVTDERQFCHFGTKVATAMLDAGVLSADAAGRAAMAASYFGAGVAASGAHFADAFWTNALVAKFADSLFAANAASRAKFADGIWNADKLAADAVTTDKILNENVTAAKIANRTRTLFVPITGAYNYTDSQPVAVTNNLNGGWALPDNKGCVFYGHFYTPSDFVSGMTVKIVVIPGASGNGYFQLDASHGANNENYATHTATAGPAAEAVVASLNEEVASLALPDVAAGDYVALRGDRDGANVADTIGNYVYAIGFIVSYTADS